MTLQTSGTITLSQIQSEHGGANPIGMNELYRGGSNVQNHNNTDGTLNPTAIPTSGTISINQFYGSSNNATVVGNNFAVMTSGTYQEVGKFPNLYTGYDARTSGSTTGIGSASDNTIRGSNGTDFTVIALFTTNGQFLALPTFVVSGNYNAQQASSVFGYTTIKWGSLTVATALGVGNYISSNNTTVFNGSLASAPSGTANITFA